MIKLNRDLINSIPVGVAANDAMALVDQMQDITPERQIVACAAVYRLMVERFKVSPQDIHTVTDNIMNHAEGRRVEFDAVKAYMEGEL